MIGCFYADAFNSISIFQWSDRVESKASKSSMKDRLTIEIARSFASLHRRGNRINIWIESTHKRDANDWFLRFSHEIYIFHISRRTTILAHNLWFVINNELSFVWSAKKVNPIDILLVHFALSYELMEEDRWKEFLPPFLRLLFYVHVRETLWWYSNDFILFKNSSLWIGWSYTFDCNFVDD